ncbi:MAG: hypothetical protein ACTHMA_22455, partial [Thermomicrobiales bacterium]
SKRVVAIDLGGAALTGGDGLLLEGQTLYVMRNAATRLVTLHLAADFASGTVVGTTTDPTFAFPTAVARVGDPQLVVNSQQDKRTTNQPPTLPFTVSSLPVPVAAPGLPNTGAGGARAPQRLGALAARGAGLVALLTSLGLLRVRRVAAEA